MFIKRKGSNLLNIRKSFSEQFHYRFYPVHKALNHQMPSNDDVI